MHSWALVLWLSYRDGRNRSNVVLLAALFLEECRKAERVRDILGKLQAGMKLKGIVSPSLQFAHLLTLAAFTWFISSFLNHVNHPSEVVKVGQEVEVQVLDVDLNRERRPLGLKQTSEDPWRTYSKYPVDCHHRGHCHQACYLSVHLLTLATALRPRPHLRDGCYTSPLHPRFARLATLYR